MRYVHGVGTCDVCMCTCVHAPVKTVNVCDVGIFMTILASCSWSCEFVSASFQLRYNSARFCPLWLRLVPSCQQAGDSVLGSSLACASHTQIGDYP